MRFDCVGLAQSGEAVTLGQRNRATAERILSWFAKAIPRDLPSAWVALNVIFNEPEIKGLFDFIGREYLRQWIDDAADPNITDQTICSGTGAGKTIAMMARTAWTMENDPQRGLWVMPTTELAGGARNFSKTRLIPMIKATKCLAEKVPKGATRHDVSPLHISMAGNVIDFVGSNSPGQIGSNRCRWVQQDEKDKFAQSLKEEAGAGYLANERTKGVAGAKRYGTSTPTVEDGPIWVDLMASDLRRRFVVCPLCGGNHPSSRRFVMVRSLQYTVLPTKMDDGTPIPLAHMEWDKEAMRTDGSIDLDRVVRSCRFVCPHCGGHIQDKHRIAMDASGEWIPTRRGSPHHAGYHLPSWYGCWRDFDSSFGGMAKKFVDAMDSGLGMRGWINSEAAEVDIAQEFSGGRIVLESDEVSGPDWVSLMSCDFQKNWPYLWFVVQRWSCFKLQPPLTLVDGRPDFLSSLEGNPRLKTCLDALTVNPSAWPAICELLRLTSRADDRWPLLDYLIAQGITGDKLAKLFGEVGGTAEAIGAWIFRQIGKPMPRGGDSEIVAAGHCEMSGDDAWRELADYQKQFEVGSALRFWGMSENRGLLVDSGYAEEHNPEVLRKCFESGSGGTVEFYDPTTRRFTSARAHVGCRPVLIDGWIPFKGYPITKRWKVNGVDSECHFAAGDPFAGTDQADKFAVPVLEAASDLFFHRWMDSRERQDEIKRAIAKGESYRGNVWAISPKLQLFPKSRFTIEQFSQQLNSKGRNPDGEIWERGKGGSGKKRHPDHLNDCCRNMYALAQTHGVFSYDKKDK